MKSWPTRAAGLQRCGYVLYLRHGYTDNSRADQFPNVDLADCNAAPARRPGAQPDARCRQSPRKAKIPLGEILVSPMCRTLESARLAIGDQFATSEALMYSANMTREQKQPRLEALKNCWPPLPAGGNRLLLAHAPTWPT